MGGASLPVIVRVYQLQTREKFQAAEFESLWKKETEALGKDLLDRREFSVAPGATVHADVRRVPSTEYLAFMALFRRPEGQTWRRFLTVGGRPVKTVRVSLKHNDIVIRDVEPHLRAPASSPELRE